MSVTQSTEAAKNTRTVGVQPGSFARAMRVLYIVFAWLFALCILIQVFLAGLGVFVSGTWFSTHMEFAHFFEGLPLFMLIVALLGRLPRSFPLLSLLLIVQFALQYAFVELAGSLNVAFLAAFHPVNAIVMFWVTVYVARRATAYAANKK